MAIWGEDTIVLEDEMMLIFFEDEHGDAVTVNQERHVEEALSPFCGS